MNYQFPIIKDISDVLPVISGKSEFIVAERDYFDIINYVVMGNTTFPPVTDRDSAIFRECRGLIFDKTGKLLSRPLHKFFNYGEREETLPQNMVFKDYNILTKEDGSMIRPVWIESRGEFWWCTKMGMSDTAKNAHEFANNNTKYIEFAKWARDENFTPIFEWCSPKNRVVLNYSTDKLVLLAIRGNHTGNYMPFSLVADRAEEYKIPVVSYLEDVTPEQLKESAKTLVGIEGFVIRFYNGHMVKIKTDEYSRIHKVKEIISNDRSLMELYIENKLDDIKPALPHEDMVRVTLFEDMVIKRIQDKVIWLDETFVEVSNKYIDRRDFAINSKLDSVSKSMIFSKYDGKVSTDIVLSVIGKHLSSVVKYDLLMEKILV